MNATVYRASCGTHLGLRLHQDSGEAVCGTCVAGEQYRLLTRELVPTRPVMPEPEFAFFDDGIFRDDEVTIARRVRLLSEAVYGTSAEEAS